MNSSRTKTTSVASWLVVAPSMSPTPPAFCWRSIKGRCIFPLSTWRRPSIAHRMRLHGTPYESTAFLKNLQWMRMLYSCAKSRVQASAGTSMEFPISVVITPRPALSPLFLLSSLTPLHEIFRNRSHGRC